MEAQATVLATAVPNDSAAKEAEEAQEERRQTPVVLAAGIKPVPPLSCAIPFLVDKLDNLTPVYTEIPSNVCWTDSKSLQTSFPPLQKPRYGNRQVPQALLLDAATEMDKLIVVNWWRTLSQQQQREECTSMRMIYSAPTVSNRLLPPIPPPKTPPPPAAVAVAAPSPKRETMGWCCRGWKGDKYEQLFRHCYADAFEKSRTMTNGAKPIDSIPIPTTLSQATGCDQLLFCRELGEDSYVLRSIHCTTTNPINKSPFCQACSKLGGVVSNLRTLIIRHHHAKTTNSNTTVMAEKQQEKITKLREKLRNAERREKRLRDQLLQARQVQQQPSPPPESSSLSASDKKRVRMEHPHQHQQPQPSYYPRI